MTTEQLYNMFLRSAGVSTDTRSIKKDQIFFALSGENFNGNKFAKEAIDKGAAYAVIDDPSFKGSEKFLVVPKALEALQHLAAHHRKQLKAKLIAITGSNGKTTSKELLHSVLKTTYKTYATEGNLNNHIGVPLTLLRINNDIEYAIIEMGANHVGEIKSYCKIADPDFGIITNVGKAHLEGFKSLEGVKKAKGELYDHLKKTKGTAFVNADHHYLLQMAKGINSVFTYGTGEQADYHGKLLSADPFLKIKYTGDVSCEIDSRLIGKYNFENILLAAAVGDYFEVSAEKIKEGIESYRPSNNRSQLIEKNGNTIILDAYNANPSSMKNALESLETMKGDRKIAVLGDMLELGKDSLEEHFGIAKMAERLHLHKLILVGEEFAEVGKKLQLLHFNNVAECKIWFDQQFFTDSTILIKGSRKINLEKLVS